MKNFAVYGPTNIGKTYSTYLHFAAIFGESEILLIRNLEQLDRYKNQSVIIFDDISFELRKPELLIHICDRDFNSPVRILRKYIELDKAVLKVFTHNSRSAYEPILATFEQQQAIERRLDIYEVNSRECLLQTLSRLR